MQGRRQLPHGPRRPRFVRLMDGWMDGLYAACPCDQPRLMDGLHAALPLPTSPVPRAWRKANKISAFARAGVPATGGTAFGATAGDGQGIMNGLVDLHRMPRPIHGPSSLFIIVYYIGLLSQTEIEWTRRATIQALTATEPIRKPQVALVARLRLG